MLIQTKTIEKAQNRQSRKTILALRVEYGIGRLGKTCKAVGAPVFAAHTVVDEERDRRYRISS
jgi:hypothetical protein